MSKQDLVDFLKWLLEENDADYVLFELMDDFVYFPFPYFCIGTEVLEDIQKFPGGTYRDFLNWLTSDKSRFKLMYNDGWELFELVENDYHFPHILEKWDNYLKEKSNG